MEIVLLATEMEKFKKKRTAATNLKDIPLFSSSGGMVLEKKQQAAQRGLISAITIPFIHTLLIWFSKQKLCLIEEGHKLGNVITHFLVWMQAINSSQNMACKVRKRDTDCHHGTQHPEHLHQN